MANRQKLGRRGKEKINLTLVNQTGDGVIEVRTTSQTIVDFLLGLGYHKAQPGGAARVMQKAHELDALAAERQVASTGGEEAK
jgi:hypothetical protein